MLRVSDVLAGRYRLQERAGGGGMGDVWRAEDMLLGRIVAIKVLRASLSENMSFQERFRREARAIAALHGPGIVDVFDYGQTQHSQGPLSYLVMQFVNGMSLSNRLAIDGALSVHQTLTVIAQVADALHIAHLAGIIHRDVKPGNILLRDDGQVVLVDFGVARSRTNPTMTATGVVLGTVTYMSPEQASGDMLTAASDIYSLGVVAHQCLTGEPPFRAETPLGVLSAQLRNAPPPLSPGFPLAVRELVTRAMQQDPARRWATAAALSQACHSATGFRPPTNTPAARPASQVWSSARAVVPIRRTPVQQRHGRYTVNRQSGAVSHSPPRNLPVSDPPVATIDRGRRRKAYIMAVIFLILAAIGGFVIAHGWQTTILAGADERIADANERSVPFGH